MLASLLGLLDLNCGHSLVLTIVQWSAGHKIWRKERKEPWAISPADGQSIAKRVLVLDDFSPCIGASDAPKLLQCRSRIMEPNLRAGLTRIFLYVWMRVGGRVRDRKDRILYSLDHWHLCVSE